MTLAGPPRELSEGTRQDVIRIVQLWAEARARFGGTGPFLFGDFGAADIMFAPVVTRFVTYSIPVSPPVADYMSAVLDHPFMRQWIDAASEEPWVIERFEPKQA